ncbi:putative mRNA capping enzyme-domain-containing protein [Seiridium unicorne]|uniref:mRNA cap guanine-N(7) methyltransferase n=1 Tax=Seiridium unicorne TaxID=138068 RepID=A0ABR2VB95_9PEZI
MASDAEHSPRQTKRLIPGTKRKHSQSPDRSGSRSARRDDGEEEELPQPYDAKKLEPAKKRQRSTSPSAAPRKQKRPGRVARLSDRERDEARRRHEERERAAAIAAEHAARGAINDVVRQHYNAVPERGRDWRKTDSNIKGLRVFNNWIKSTIIQKFSPDEDHTPGAHEQGRDLAGVGGKELLVLDIGCGKGGDLGKWQQAPQPVQLYVGLDPAEVSIQQAQDRFRQMGQRGGRGGRGGHRGGRNQHLFEAYFYPKDCYGTSIADINIIRDVGFESSMGTRGFDIVSMMFCMHYAFETEQKARQMLKNVSGALKKGGRLLGCIPNSDIIGERVTEFNERMAAQNTDAPEGEAPPSDDREEGEAEKTAEWGNSLYRVRFPGKTPADGIFRPPFGWKYNFFLDEAVEEVPEYVVPWEAFRALAEDYNLELQWHESFRDIWEKEKDDRVLGPLSERMGVRERGGGSLLVSPQEMEVANFYVAFCFYKV